MKKHNNPPAFQMYASDILGDPFFDTLSAEEFGCYCLLLLNLWVNGGKLKLDFKQIQRICHLKSTQTTQKILRRLHPRLNMKRRFLSSEYIDQQMQNVLQQRLKSIKGGLASGRKRQEEANQRANQKSTLQTPDSNLQYINNIINKLAAIWRQFSSKEIDDDQIDILRTLFVSENNPLQVHGEEALIKALQNYRRARQLEGSKAWDWSFFLFFYRGYEKYLPGRFDIDNYDPNKFKTNPSKGGHSDGGRATIKRTTTFNDPEATRAPLEL